MRRANLSGRKEISGDGVAYVQPDFDDSSWQQINLPHDWAIEGPFTHSGGGGMGRLPSCGHRLVSQEAGYSGGGRGQIDFSGCGRRDVLRDGLVERPVRRRLALRLCVVAGGLDAVRETGRRE